MPRYWVIAPLASSDVNFDKIWEFDLANNLISIGWSEIGDPSKITKQGISEAVSLHYSDVPNATKSLFTNMLWSFYNEISTGDYIIARRGRKSLLAVGRVLRPGYFCPGKNPYLASEDYSHPNFIDVNWQDIPKNRNYPNIVFPMHTLYELAEEDFASLVGPDTSEYQSEIAQDQNEFVLEKYLEDFIVSNFPAIFKGELTIYGKSEGMDGQQYATDIGPIDILAVEPSTNSLVVIELKKGRPSDQVVGQVLRYMGWIKKNLCQENQSVKGLIICREHDPKLAYAMSMINNVDVRYYSVSFTLKRDPQ